MNFTNLNGNPGEGDRRFKPDFSPCEPEGRDRELARRSFPRKRESNSESIAPGA